jgi:hypothetical protein
MSLLLWSFALIAVAFALSPALRRWTFNHVVFPFGYFLYTSKFAGYTLHQARYMSSRESPAVPHTKVDSIKSYGEGDAAVKVVPVPLLEDNYSYLILHEKSKTAAVVDPADPFPITEGQLSARWRERFGTGSQCAGFLIQLVGDCAHMTPDAL